MIRLFKQMIVAVVTAAFGATAAHAQITGQFPPATLYGNASAASAIPGPVGISALTDIGTPNTTLDWLLIQNHVTGTLQKINPADLLALGVASVSNSDGSLTVSPTTGAVVASLNPNHSNTFIQPQIFQGATGITALSSGAGLAVNLKTFGAASTVYPVINGLNAGGTSGSPTQTLVTSELLGVYGYGYGSDGGYHEGGGIEWISTEAYDANHTGMIYWFYASPTGLNTLNIVASLDGLGTLSLGYISALGAITGGSGYNGSVTHTFTNVPLTVSSGTVGTNAQATIVVTAGVVTSVTITQSGIGYDATSVLSASNTNLGGSGSGFSVPVASPGAGGSLSNGGSGQLSLYSAFGGGPIGINNNSLTGAGNYTISLPQTAGTIGQCLLSGGAGGYQTWAKCVNTAPEGRLTLQSSTPVMTVDQVGVSTIYYDCFGGGQVPYYNGTIDAIDAITSCQVSMTLEASGTGVQNASGVFDIFWWHNSGSPVLCVPTNGSGGGWASDTAGSNTARGTGYSQIDLTSRPYPTNKNALTHCYNGTTDYGSIAANQATYLGTFYTTAAGQTGVALKPAAAAGGVNNIVGLWNAFNRVRASALNKDSTAAWSGTSAGSTFAAADASNNNRISFVDGLQRSSISAVYKNSYTNGTAGEAAAIGCNLDSTSATPVDVAGVTSVAKTSISADCRFYPQLGFHFVQAVEATQGGTPQFNVTGSLYGVNEGLILELDF